MKKVILLIAIHFVASGAVAQDSVMRKNRLTQSVIEQFWALKSNKEIKQGLYQAIYRRRVALASGNYANNKRIGTWHFYDKYGRLVQNFNYERNSIAWEIADDTLTAMHIGYGFDDKITDSDRVTKPMKVGGSYYGYIPYIKSFRLSDDYMGTDLSQFTAILEILVSPGGRLADFKVHIKSPVDERITTFSTDLINEDDRLFVPATINHKAVLSRIFVKCRITDDGELDID
ncbi:hypothetical protein [Mucilaginibacter sp.]